jgi:glycosyltransferase involved in cell wall biosynthesis
VLVDLLFCQPGYHGGGEYGKAVFKALLNKFILTGDFQLWVALNPDLYIDRWVWDVCAEFGVNVVSVESYSDIVDVVNLDLFYSFFTPAIVVYTGYEYMSKVGNDLPFNVKITRVIGTLHDIRDYELMISFPEIFNLRKSLGCLYENSIDRLGYEEILNKNSIVMSDLKGMYSNIIADSSVEVVTISEYCRKSIIKNIGLPANPMLVSMSPMKVRPKPTHQELSSYGIGESGFCLLLHASRKEKNAAAVVRAFESIFDEGEFEDLKVILTGINALQDLDIDIKKYSDRFIPVGELAPEMLEFFLKETKLLIYPSLNEGLGYPPIEALTYATPCIASNITAIPETCGDLIYYFDPYSQSSIISGITMALASKRDIDVEKVKELFNKQNDDLNKLCEKILYGR